MIDERRLYAYVGKRIKELREGKPGVAPRMTQAQLAKQVGLERTSITNIEKGEQKVPLHVLYRICSVLNVDIQEVLPALQEVKGDEWSPQQLGVLGEISLPPMAAAAVSKYITT